MVASRKSMERKKQFKQDKYQSHCESGTTNWICVSVRFILLCPNVEVFVLFSKRSSRKIDRQAILKVKYSELNMQQACSFAANVQEILSISIFIRTPLWIDQEN